MRTQAFLLTATLCVVTHALAAPPARADTGGDIDTLEQRLVDRYLVGTDSAEAGTHLKTQQPDGSWRGIDYANRDGRGGWDVIAHLDRVYAMSVAYRGGHDGPLKGDEKLLAGIVKGLKYWFAADPGAHWWWNDIGMQLRLGPIGVLMHEHLPGDVVDKITDKLRDDVTTTKKTGQNLIWIAQQAIWQGVIRRDVEDIRRGVGPIEEQVVIQTGSGKKAAEGLQEDMSWHQHGPQLYNGAYGMAAAGDLSTWAFMTSGLSFGFKPEKVDLIERFMLDGSGWMTYGPLMDPSAMGRVLAEEGRNNVLTVRLASAPSGNLNYRDAVDYMAKMNRPRSPEAAALMAQIRGEGPSWISGNKAFYRSDFMIHRRPNYYVSVKAASDRVYTQETGNKQNTKGRFLSYGAQYIQTRGDEYLDIFQAWDWSKIPGVTAFANTDKEVLSPDTWGTRGPTEYVGGASDGRYGAFGMDLKLAFASGKKFKSAPALTGRKSRFFFDQQFVALGAGITFEGDDNIRTTVNQTFQHGDIAAVDAQGRSHAVGAGTMRIDGGRWIHHRDIGYVFLDAAVVEVTRDNGIFAATIEHGTKPANATYAYMVLPNADAAATRGIAQKPPVAILSNTPELQAVRQTDLGVTEAVFYAAGKLAIGPDHWLAADQPCVLVYVEGQHIAAANPTGGSVDLTVTLHREGSREQKIGFAGLGLASQTQELKATR